MAMRAAGFRHRQPPAALTLRTVLLPRDGDVALAAPHGLLEIERDHLVQIDPALRPAFCAPRFAQLKDVGEKIPERLRVGPGDAHGEIEAIEPDA